MYYRGKMFGFVHLYNGQEAVSTGVIKQLRKDDYVTSTYRDHVHAISKGCSPREVMAELFTVDAGSWQREAELTREYFQLFGDRVPAELHAELDALTERLTSA